MANYREQYKNCTYRKGTVPFPKDADIMSILPAFPPQSFDVKKFMETACLSRCTSPKRKSDICSSNCPELDDTEL